MDADRVIVDRAELDALFGSLRERGYTVIGPTVRSQSLVYALGEALRLIEAYEPPDPPGVEVLPRAGTRHGWTEAPRGMLWHRYAIDDGTILDAKIVPPTSPVHLVRDALLAPEIDRA